MKATTNEAIRLRTYERNYKATRLRAEHRAQRIHALWDTGTTATSLNGYLRSRVGVRVPCCFSCVRTPF